MKRIAKFHKVSKEQFREGYLDLFSEASQEEADAVYELIKLPSRATSGSAGYDFNTQPSSISARMPVGTLMLSPGIS